VRKTDNLPPSCAVVMSSANPNFLEPCGPLQACDGNDLTFFYFTGYGDISDEMCGGGGSIAVLNKK